MRTEPTPEQRAQRALEGRRYAQARRDILDDSQLQLAQRLGVDIKTIKRRENGKRRIKTLNWLALCGIHQISAFKNLDLLLCGNVAGAIDGGGIWEVVKTGEASQAIKSLPLSVSCVLRSMRDTCKMSSAQWAGALGVDVGTIHNSESGSHGITREFFFASVALFLEVKFQTVDLQRRTHRYPKHLSLTEHFEN